jgi:leucyl/phenylalanyl-tRNA---protein transferase
MDGRHQRRFDRCDVDAAVRLVRVERAARETLPHADEADGDGVVAVGAAPTPDLLAEAYQHGIFPWPHSGMPLLWFSPNPRFVLDVAHAHVPKSLAKAMKKTELVIKSDTAFLQVIEACSKAKRTGQRGTWITRPMIAGYEALHRRGFAHSIEAWLGDRLVGGLYGVSYGGVFFGESMFAHVDDASKITFATLLAQLRAWDMPLVDCQSHTTHLERFGAVHVPRADFLARLDVLFARDTRVGPWAMSVTPAEAAS